MNKSLTQLEFTESDHKTAREIAKRLRRADQGGVYTTQSNLIGLQLSKQFNGDTEVTIIKTKEFGFTLVQTMEDLNFFDLMDK